MLNRNNTICFLNLIRYILEDFHEIIKNNKICESVIFKFKHFHPTLHVYPQVFQGTATSDVWKLWPGVCLLSISTEEEITQFLKRRTAHTKDKKSSGFQSAVSLFGGLVLLSTLHVVVRWEGDEARKVPQTTALGISECCWILKSEVTIPPWNDRTWFSYQGT